jgi:hypothetical protein
MRKGATIIGQQQGGEYDRAYVSLVGFIDPESKRFVKAQGVRGTRVSLSDSLDQIRVVELKLAESYSYEAVRRVLKKTNSSRG